MCRLLAYAATSDTTFAEIVGEGFENFVAMSDEHKDGWGITSIDKAGKVSRTVDLERAVASSTFVDVKDRPADSGLLHLRLASKGLTIDIKNKHPVVDGTYSFMHNGTIRPAASVEAFIDPEFANRAQGSTDSERYFYYILTEIDKSDFITGIKNAVNYVRKNQEYSSINGMVMNEDYYVVIAEYDLMEIPAIFTEDYYELKFKKSQDSVIVGSSGWNQAGWEVLPNHHLLVVNRKTLDVEIIKLDA